MVGVWYTYDGFRKPELGASGRYMVGAVPASATLTSERPDNVVAPGYMQLSGTSFATPVVAGSAAHVLAAHPEYTPDEVKAALMVTARPTGAAPYSLGVGEADAVLAATVDGPLPNPNAALEDYLATDGTFDSDAWQSAAQSDANWNTANWNQANWNVGELERGELEPGELEHRELEPGELEHRELEPGELEPGELERRELERGRGS